MSIKNTLGNKASTLASTIALGAAMALTSVAKAQFTAPAATPPAAKPASGFTALSRVENVTPTEDAINTPALGKAVAAPPSAASRFGKVLLNHATGAVGSVARDTTTVAGNSSSTKKVYDDKADAKKFLDDKIQPHLTKGEDVLVTFLSQAEAEKLDGRLATAAGALAIVNFDPTNEVVQKFYPEMIKNPLYVYPAAKGAAVQQTPSTISRDVLDIPGTLEKAFHTKGSAPATPKP